eukprot:2214952-Heterocapsa_arctica.AAC.1
MRLDLAPVDHVRDVSLRPERAPQLSHERSHLRNKSRHPSCLCSERAELRLLHHAALALEEGADDRSNLHDFLVRDAKQDTPEHKVHGHRRADP